MRCESKVAEGGGRKGEGRKKEGRGGRVKRGQAEEAERGNQETSLRRAEAGMLYIFYFLINISMYGYIYPKLRPLSPRTIM